MRESSEFLDSILDRPFPVLDHGEIRCVDYMGTEASIVRAARTSYGKGTKATSEDAGLLRYLMRHRHTSPLEFCELAVRVKMPIFVARQWIRHRTANVNEYSARYSILDKEFYIPEADVLAAQSKTNKQGRGAVVPTEYAQEVQALLVRDAARAYDTYDLLLNDIGDGTPQDPERPQLARELARMNLSLNYYTTWYWKTDLHNLLHFLSLRLDPHAQYEIRVYADELWRMVQGWVPTAAQAFLDYRLEAISFSRGEAALLRDLVREAADAARGAHEAEHGLGTWSEAQWRKKMRARMEPISEREAKAFWRALGILTPEDP